MIVLLVLLPALVFAAAAPVIDWTKCGGLENKCYCLNPQSELVEHDHKERDENEKKASLEQCSKIGLQNKFFNEDVALFLMQVIGDDSLDLGEEPSLMLYQGDIELFGCKLDKTTGKVEISGNNQKSLLTHKISLFEDRSRFESGNVLCAIKIERVRKYIKTLKNSDTTELRLIKPNPFHKEFGVSGTGLFLRKGMKCDPTSFNSLPSSQKYRVLPLKNIDQMTINCDNYGNSYTMRYVKSEQEYEMERLECEATDATKTDYAYSIIKKGLNGNYEKEIVTDPDEYTFFCAANFNEVCPDPRGNCTSASDVKCLKYHAGGKADPATLKCDENKWLIDGEYTVLASDPVCKQDTYTNSNEAAFFATLPTGDEAPIAGAQCFKEYDCKKKSNLIFACEDETQCGKPDDSNGILKCKNESLRLRVYDEKANVTLNETSYTCNPSSGLYEHGALLVPARSQVRCDEITEQKFAVAQAGLSDGASYGIIIGACVLFISATVGGLLMYLCYVKRRNRIKISAKKEWLKLKTAERVAQCKEDFGNVLLATPANAYRILDGLKMIELLLDTETEDPAVWEEAYKFLMRFQGAVVRTDHGVWHMFSRYLYLQARKIIDKHDWLTSKPIAKKSPEGLIRTVAIQLLAFSMYDPHSNAEELLNAGYRKLGFHGDSQYPHAGLLWSVILHARRSFNPKKDPANEKIRHLNALKFMKQLREIADKKTIAVHFLPEDVIPEFGSIAQQAAFALGAAPLQYLQGKITEKFMFECPNSEEGAVPKAYFAGLCQSLNRNPTETMLDACNMWPEPNPDFLVKMVKVAPEDEWNSLVQSAIRLVIYYGRQVDVKRLHTCFMPKQPDDEFARMQNEQQDFERAMEEIKEDLRAWLAKRTDKEELKKKPDYTVNTKIHLDNRVNGDEVKKEAKSSKSKSTTRSSNSKSSKSSDHADPKAATAAAAPVAAAAAATVPQQ